MNDKPAIKWLLENIENDILRLHNLYENLAMSLTCGYCGEITNIASEYTCAKCGRMLCEKCGKEIGYCKDHVVKN